MVHWTACGPNWRDTLRVVSNLIANLGALGHNLICDDLKIPEVVVFRGRPFDRTRKNIAARGENSRDQILQPIVKEPELLLTIPLDAGAILGRHPAAPERRLRFGRLVVVDDIRGIV